MLPADAGFDSDFSVRRLRHFAALERNGHETGEGRLAKVTVVVEPVDHRLSAIGRRVCTEQTIVNRQQIRLVGIGFRHLPGMVNLVNVRRDPERRQHAIERCPEANVAVFKGAVGGLQQALDHHRLSGKAE